jgi:hypothetical protein
MNILGSAASQMNDEHHLQERGGTGRDGLAKRLDESAWSLFLIVFERSNDVADGEPQ